MIGFLSLPKKKRQKLQRESNDPFPTYNQDSQEPYAVNSDTLQSFHSKELRLIPTRSLFSLSTSTSLYYYNREFMTVRWIVVFSYTIVLIFPKRARMRVYKLRRFRIMILQSQHRNVTFKNLTYYSRIDMIWIREILNKAAKRIVGGLIIRIG